MADREYGAGRVPADVDGSDELVAQLEAEALQPIRRQALVLCDCGHRVPKSWVMSTSLGTACPDCYDRMSDQFDY